LATNKKKDEQHTPLMGQYYRLKAQHPDAILLFRVGDFYETFGEDAVKTSKALGIVLTNRNNGTSDTELAGFPYHALDVYLPKLVRAGYRVAVCEQLEKPSKEKKIVKRGITDVITPGTALDEKLLDHRKNNYLCSLYYHASDKTYGIAFLDVSTGEFMVSEGGESYIDKLLQSFQPSEIIFSKSHRKTFEEKYGESFYAYLLDEWIFTEEFTLPRLLEHFQVLSLKGFGIEELNKAKIAAGAILYYLNTTEKKELQHINNISRIHADQYVWLDRFTIRNLELLHSPHDTGKPLIDVLDRTVTPMGSRLMRKWLILPLTQIEQIRNRQRVVHYVIQEKDIIQELIPFLKQIGDLERLIAKVPASRINPREVAQLLKALQALDDLRNKLLQIEIAEIRTMADGINPCIVLRNIISNQLTEDPPTHVSKGNTIALGVSEELDDLKDLITNSKDKLAAIQAKEAMNTGITNLKIGFNNVFGYYLEVTNKYKHQNLVPNTWVRKQTLSNAERYITDELKQLESKILTAEDKILELEEELFNNLILIISEYIQPIQHNAQITAQIDCLISFARLAIDKNYVKPTVDESLTIDIHDGRHPVIEDSLPPGESYVPNDVYLNNEDQQILLITGPNMAGKSALLRQTALICLLAQMGSFVPAKSATLGIVDKIFTRVGASDNISSGESTFMVEMNETASIMNNLSKRSLILLDEIGRGTSTYDGISIAWSLAEFLHNNTYANPKTLFATHYHELNELAEKFNRIRNFSIATKEVGQKVIFLRKLIPGGSQHSFGIHVARMAGMPNAIVDRANEILYQLEQKFIEDNKSAVKGRSRKTLQQMSTPAYQLSIFQTKDPKAEHVAQLLREIDVNNMTPIDCFLKIQELQNILRAES
jgi:DNA mismatch repair protein MutS